MLEDRIKTLLSIVSSVNPRKSHINITVRKEKNVSVFEFYSNKRPIKTCFTYQKAKLFAEGINFGINL